MDQHPHVQPFLHADSGTWSYVVHAPAGTSAAIIDPVLDYDAASARTSAASAQALVDYVAAHALSVDWLLETHAHADHLSAAPLLQARVGGRLAIGAHITEVQEVFGKIFNAGTRFARDGSQFDQLFADGDRFRIGGLECHDYTAPGRDAFAWETTIGAQRTGNVHVREGVTEAAFVAMREAHDATLSMPKLILPSVQVNMRGGHLPEPEDNGVRYLKLPVDAL